MASCSTSCYNTSIISIWNRPMTTRTRSATFATPTTTKIGTEFRTPSTTAPTSPTLTRFVLAPCHISTAALWHCYSLPFNMVVLDNLPIRSQATASLICKWNKQAQWASFPRTWSTLNSDIIYLWWSHKRAAMTAHVVESLTSNPDDPSSIRLNFVSAVSFV